MLFDFELLVDATHAWSQGSLAGPLASSTAVTILELFVFFTDHLLGRIIVFYSLPSNFILWETPTRVNDFSSSRCYLSRLSPWSLLVFHLVSACHLYPTSINCINYRTLSRVQSRCSPYILPSGFLRSSCTRENFKQAKLK